MISTYTLVILIPSSIILANSLRNIADEHAAEHPIIQKRFSDINSEDFGPTKIDPFTSIASSSDTKTDEIINTEDKITSIDPEFTSGYLQDGANPEILPTEPKDISIADTTDDPSTSSVGWGGVGDDAEKYTRKRDLLSQTPSNACPVNRPSKKKKSNSRFGSLHPSLGGQTEASPRPKTKFTEQNPCPVNLPSGKTSLQLIHVSCGGPIVGDFPLNPDYVLNCVPGQSAVISVLFLLNCYSYRPD